MLEGLAGRVRRKTGYIDPRTVEALHDDACVYYRSKRAVLEMH